MRCFSFNSLFPNHRNRRLHHCVNSFCLSAEHIPFSISECGKKPDQSKRRVRFLFWESDKKGAIELMTSTSNLTHYDHACVHERSHFPPFGTMWSIHFRHPLFHLYDNIEGVVKRDPILFKGSNLVLKGDEISSSLGFSDFHSKYSPKSPMSYGEI